MTTLASGLNAVNRACLATSQANIYRVNNFDVCKKWNGIASTLLDAGITAPAAVLGAPTAGAGGLSNGDHLIRYRYKDTSTGFVSNPSLALTYTVSSGNGLLTFGIGVADDIRTTTDPKVDQYVIEATAVGGGFFFQLGTAAVGATSVVVGMSDPSLIQQFNSSIAYGREDRLETYSNERPPLGTIILPYRGRMWVLGDEPYLLTAVTFTNNSTAITGAGFSTAWDDGAGFLLVRDGDTKAYEISAVASATAMTLSVAWTGSTGPYSARVVKRFPNRGYYSGVFLPEGFFLSRWARDFLAETSDTVTSGVGRKDALYVFGRNNTERLIFNFDPSADAGAIISPLKGIRGNWTRRTIIDVEGELYAWDRQGMWVVGEVPKPISQSIDELLKEYVDYDERRQFHTAFDPENRVILFFFVQAGDTVPKTAACFEVDTGRWFLNTFLQGMTASKIVPTTDGQVRLMLADENGYSWYFGINGSFDGPPPTTETVLTVTGSPSTTVIPVTQTLPTVAPALNGIMVYNPLTGESRYSSSNTSSAITVAVAFSAAPTVGQELYLGPILFEYRTKWWVGNGQETRKNPPYLLLNLFPGSETGTMRVYFYADMSTSPSQVTKFVADQLPDGVTCTNGDYFLTVALSGSGQTDVSDGVLSIPIPIEWKNSIQARMTSSRPDGDLRVLDAQFILAQSGEADDVGT